MPDYIKSPELTADWENKLLQVEKGTIEAEAFMSEMEVIDDKPEYSLEFAKRKKKGKKKMKSKWE